MRIGSLFSGYGGLDIAVQSVLGGELAWYSEIEPAACRVLAAHHPGMPNLGDVTAVDWTTVPPVDVLTGGYPCQPFSHAGKRKGTNDERHLWPYVRDAIRVLRPRLTVLENVRGHLTLGFDIVLADLAELGMSARWGTVRAADAGAPHGRARLFIVVSDATEQGSQGRDAAGVPALGSGRRSAGGQPAQGADGAAPDAGRGSLAGTGAAGVGLLEPAERGYGPAPDADRDGHGRELHARGMGRLEGEAAGGPRERQRPRREPDAGGDLVAPDADGGWLGVNAGGASGTQAGAHSGDGPDGTDRGWTDWGKYAPAIHRWERVLGRPAPAPTVPGRNGRPRLSPVLVEWMMGLPQGHVTGHGLSAAQELKMLGNGVVPQQAALALRMLLGEQVAA